MVSSQPQNNNGKYQTIDADKSMDTVQVRSDIHGEVSSTSILDLVHMSLPCFSSWSLSPDHVSACQP